MNDPDLLHIQWTEAARWIGKADDDIVVAEMSLGHDPALLDPAAFHCQQAVEKIIKALLVAAAVPTPRTHDIERLAETATPIYPAFHQQMQAFLHLTEWLTATRYPDLGGGLGEDISTVTDMLIAIKVFRQAVAALAPFPV